MGIKERRNIEKEEMKIKIMSAAIDLIEEDGYEKLSIRKIAAKIEYSPTTIYLYYKDKAEIITDISQAIYSKVENSAIETINNSRIFPIDKQVHNVLRSVIISLCAEPEIAKALMHSGTSAIFGNISTSETPTNAGIGTLDSLLDDGIAQKVLRTNIANTSWMIMSALLGFVMSVIENELYKLDNFLQLVDNYVEILMMGIMR